MNIFDLSGRIAIVTGGNQGIGFAIARGLASAGATVIIANRRSTEGQAAAEALKGEGLNAAAFATDVSNDSSIRNLVANVISDFGTIDVLVNSAAVILRKPAITISKEEWDYVMDINLRGVFICCQFVGKEMIRKKKGKIINISSDAAYRAMAERSVYAVSKAGVSHLTRCLALEWAKYNINVNAIGPGPTMTPMTREYWTQNPKKLKQAVKSVPVGRIGNPSDYVGIATFLASDASNFVTGQTLLVEGGSTIR